MSGFWDSYDNLSETLITYSQHLLAPEILIPSVLGVGAVVVASIVVAMDGDRGRHVERVVHAFIPTFVVLPFIVLGIWLANGGDDTIKEPARSMPDGNILAVLVFGLFKVAWILFITVVFFLFPFVMLAGLAVVGYSLVRASPDLIMILFLALAPVGRGLWTLVRLPLLGLREVIFAFTRPRAVKEIWRAYKQRQTSTKESIKRARVVREHLAREAGQKLKTRWWSPDLTIFTSIWHYNVLAKYIESLSRVQKAVNDDLKHSQRKNDDK